MVTDPPYGVQYDPGWRVRRGVTAKTNKMGRVLNDDCADWRGAWSLFSGDVAYVWCASMHNDEVIESLEAWGFTRRAHVIWVKDRFTLGRGDYQWQHAPLWYCVKGSAHWCGDRKQSTVWTIPAHAKVADAAERSTPPLGDRHNRRHWHAHHPCQHCGRTRPCSISRSSRPALPCHRRSH
jgi:hypothetical protein